jgi:hypothetical protein
VTVILPASICAPVASIGESEGIGPSMFDG